MNDSKDFQDAESVRSGNSHVTSRPVSFPPHPIPEGILRHSFVSTRELRCQSGPCKGCQNEGGGVSLVEDLAKACEQVQLGLAPGPLRCGLPHGIVRILSVFCTHKGLRSEQGVGNVRCLFFFFLRNCDARSHHQQGFVRDTLRYDQNKKLVEQTEHVFDTLRSELSKVKLDPRLTEGEMEGKSNVAVSKLPFVGMKASEC